MSASRRIRAWAVARPQCERRALRLAATLAAGCALAALMGASEPGNRRILTCKDANGNPVLADPSDPRCFKPPPTPDEVAQRDEAFRKEMESYRACMAEQRAYQLLLARYPDRAAHDAARRKALDSIEAQIRATEGRIEQLLREEKRLQRELEFYPDGNVPPTLKREIESNAAQLAGRRQAIATQRAEAEGINAFYDKELAKLKSLWSPQPGAVRGCKQPRIVKDTP